MVITISDSSTKIYIPVPPEELIKNGAAYFREYKIMNKGLVKHPNGRELDRLRWESFFPGANLMDLPFVNRSNKLSATELHKKIESWKNNGTKVKVNVTGTPFNLWMYISEYEARTEDAFGSIYYDIEFIEAVEVSVTTTKAKVVSKPRASKTTTKKKYTVKKGDNLWKIARKFYGGSGSTWKKIYNANKSIIEKTAKKYGRKSSSNGHWIYPGTVLTIP